MPYREAGYEYINRDMENRKLLKFCQIFYVTASLQGRLAYMLMSIHAVNPSIVKSFTDYNPYKYLLANMIYGIGVMIFFRPAMTPISLFNRITFSILGSLMFNQSSMLLYNWMAEKLAHRPYVLTFMGFVSGRVMMLYFLAYLYHIDSKYRGSTARPQADYEAMYREN